MEGLTLTVLLCVLFLLYALPFFTLHIIGSIQDFKTMKVWSVICYSNILLYGAFYLFVIFENNENPFNIIVMLIFVLFIIGIGKLCRIGDADIDSMISALLFFGGFHLFCGSTFVNGLTQALCSILIACVLQGIVQLLGKFLPIKKEEKNGRIVYPFFPSLTIGYAIGYVCTFLFF